MVAMTAAVELMLWPTVSPPLLCGPWPELTFSFLLRDSCFALVLGRPLWREDGSVICNATWQWSESRRTHNHTLLSHRRLLDSPSVASHDSLGLRWKHTNPPPHGEDRSRTCYRHIHQTQNWCIDCICWRKMNT
jgi:hypothetical protein